MVKVTTRVDALSRFFPEELGMAVKGFDDKIRRAIIAVLILRGDSAFMELAKELGISKGLLSHHLDQLLDSALVRNYSSSELKGRFDSYYGISTFGKVFVDSLIQSFSLGPRMIPSSNLSPNSSVALLPGGGSSGVIVYSSPNIAAPLAQNTSSGVIVYSSPNIAAPLAQNTSSRGSVSP